MLQLLATWSRGQQVQVNIQVQAMQRKSSLPSSRPTESTGWWESCLDSGGGPAKLKRV